MIYESFVNHRPLITLNTIYLFRQGCGIGGFKDKPNAMFDGRWSCKSDAECDGMEGFSIFNHFDESESGILVPECRSIDAPPMPGFTCGSDPRLRTGTKIVVRDVPDLGDDITDNRQVRLLKSDRYEDLKSDIEIQSDCPNHEDNQCATIDHFSDGCASTDIVDGFVIFNNPFHQPGCAPLITHTGDAESGPLIEERQLYLGYDDLVSSIGSIESKVNSHKVYEISCKINKIGEVEDEVVVEQGGSIEDMEDLIDTNFFIEKYFVKNSTQRALGDDEVIPFSPNANQNDRFQFKIWSNHPDEYVHLETCSLSLGDPSTGQSTGFIEEFINDGCVKEGFQFFFSNEDRISATNEDWFDMRPILGIGSCKSTWKIDCTVASCNRSLDHCEPGDECADRYTASFMATNARKRRSAHNASSPAENHVVSNLVHPCFYVDDHNTRYCVDVQTCWSLQQCAAAFPDDFPQVTIDTDSDTDPGLHQIMEKFEAAIQEHIDHRMSENQFAHEHIMVSIRDNANRVLDNQQTFDDAIEEIIRLINA